MPPDIGHQREFAAAVRGVTLPVPAAVTSHSSPRPVERFAIYRNNVYAGLTSALASRYPVVLRLVGDEFFFAVSRMFAELHPPRSPVMLGYGAAFPDFLQRLEAAAELPYLPDVARLEWAQNEAYHAADAAPLTPDQLARLPFDEPDRLVFDLHPALRAIASDYPVFSIWRTNAHDAEVTAIDASAAPQAALVTRPALDVEVRRIPLGLHALTTSLSAGTPLLEAARIAAVADPGFDLQHGLAALIEAGAFVAYRLT